MNTTRQPNALESDKAVDVVAADPLPGHPALAKPEREVPEPDLPDPSSDEQKTQARAQSERVARATTISPDDHFVSDGNEG